MEAGDWRLETGDYFVLPSPKDVAVEWMVVRFHPDDSDLVLVVPCDDFFLIGTPDVKIGGKTFRCGQNHWLPRTILTEQCGTFPDGVVKQVRNKLAQIARGNFKHSRPIDDFDPEYEQWIDDVAKTREMLANS